MITEAAFIIKLRQSLNVLIMICKQIKMSMNITSNADKVGKVNYLVDQLL